MVVRKIIVMLLMIAMLIPVSTALRQPIGIVGYVYLNSAPVQGANVVVTNLNTDESDTATTNADGLYVCSLYGQNGDIIKATVTYGNQSGTAQTFVNLNLTTQWLNVTLGASNLIARFSYYPPNPKPNEEVKFIDRSDGNIVIWLWNFGDGTTATGKNVNHKYTKEGDYTVTLEIRDASNNYDRTSQVVHVKTVAENPFIPPVKPPITPEGYTIKEMCDLLRISNMSIGESKVRIVFIDSGVSPRTYPIEGRLVDLSKITVYTVTGDKTDDFGHGTAVGSILMYILDTKISNYDLICIKAFDAYGQSSEKTFLDAMSLAEKLNPDIVSISAGAFPSERDVLSNKAEELARRGIIVVASAGNSGSDLNTILSPAINPYVIAVGGENPERTIYDLRDDTICEWSSRGSPTLKKPNCVAPGESIRLPWGMTQERVLSGTSFSAPFVSGGIAVAISKNKGLYDLVKTIYFWDGTIITNAVKSAVEETCYPKGIYYIWGAGIPQFDKMSDALYGKLFNLLILFIALIVTAVAFIIFIAFIVIRKRL